MKKTKYFYSDVRRFGEIGTCIKQVVEKRDEFLTKEADTIGKIENEDLKLLSGSDGTNYTIVIIQLTYYPKEK